MRRRSRRSSSTARPVDTLTVENPCVIDAELSKGRFSYIFKGSSQEEVKVKHCVPLFHVRSLCHSAIQNLKKALDVDVSGTVGFNYGGGLKVVVKIPEEKLQIVEQHLLENGQSESDAAGMAFRQGICWYGIIDGVHIHRALIDLENARPDPFQDFKWTVTVVNWQSISVLKAFARTRNLLQSANVVDMTLYDTVKGLRDIGVEKANLAGEPLESYARHRGVITKIADEFCGGSKYSRQTTRTLAGAALRVKSEALMVLGCIMCEENAFLAKKIAEQSSTETVSELTVFDTRAFKKIISTNTIRGATEFLNADAANQANSLRRLKYAYESNSFKTFQAARLNQETERSARARRQINLMSDLMGRDKWPEELSDVEVKLTTTSVFDSELDQDIYERNTDKIMESLITEYKKRLPLEAGLRWNLYCRDRPSECNADNANAANVQTSSGESGAEASAFDEMSDEGSSEEAQDVAMNIESEMSCPLEQLQVECRNLTLERYMVHRNADEECFDLVTGDPSQLQLNGTCKVMISESLADKYVGILRQLVVEHGWVFLYTTAADFGIWCKAFRGSGFDPLPYPWIMVRDTNTIQVNTSPIPQCVTEILIGARKIGSGRPKHKPDIDSTYKRTVSSRKRKFAIMDNCATPRLKLRKLNTREPLRTNQRSQEPIAEFLDTFCPKNGRVLDAFAGTMETAKACMMTARKCVALEAESICFDVAFENLKETAWNYLNQNVSNPEEVCPDQSLPNGSAEGRNNHEDSIALHQMQVISRSNAEVTSRSQEPVEEDHVRMSDVSDSPACSDESDSQER